MAPNNEQLKKECDGLAGIINHFKGEAQKALNQFNSQLAYSQRLQGSFSKDNFAFVRDARGFFKEFGGDLGFGLGGRLIGSEFAGLGGSLFSSYQSAAEGDGFSSAGHLALGVYTFTNEIKPWSPGYTTMATRVLPVAAAIGVGIKAYEHFGATIYNEWQQAG